MEALAIETKSDRMRYGVIVDIDGTLADTSARLCHITKRPKDWPAFFAGIKDDNPHLAAVHLVRAVFAYGRQQVILCTGREKKHYNATMTQLLDFAVPYNRIMFRATGDRRADPIVKLEMLCQLRNEGIEVEYAIDDRPDVVRMWRDNGVPCFAANDGPWWTPEPGFVDGVEYLDWLHGQHSDKGFGKIAAELRELRQMKTDIENYYSRVMRMMRP